MPLRITSIRRRYRDRFAEAREVTTAKLVLETAIDALPDKAERRVKDQGER